MHFTFLHPEFFAWMLPPVLVLFYFWFTQKSPEFSWLDSRMLVRLRAKSSALSLHSRNILFLMAAVLMITAMAQPILYHPEAHVSRLKILLVLDLNAQRIEVSKALSLKILSRLEEDEVALVSGASLISPPTTQYRFLEELISRIGAEDSESSEEVIGAFANRYHFDSIVRAETETLMNVSEGMQEVDRVLARLQRIREKNAYRNHIPLFSYPLGAAMLLILIALSSKSARTSVSVEIFLVLVFFANTPSDAALMDFRLLGEARESYEKGEYRTSLKKFQAYQKMHDSPQISYNIANVYYKMGKFEEALYWYERVVSEDTVLMRYKNENMQRTLKYVQKHSDKEKEALENTNYTIQKRKHEPADGAAGQFAVYPLKIFLD